MRNFLLSLGAKPFHQTRGPKISAKNVEDRLWFCDFLPDWTEDDFLFLAPSDEFYIYEERRPNHQNDRIWALSIDDIPADLKVRGLSKHPKRIGVFLMFTAKRLLMPGCTSLKISLNHSLVQTTQAATKRLYGEHQLFMER